MAARTIVQGVDEIQTHISCDQFKARRAMLFGARLWHWESKPIIPEPDHITS
jgi:hypothetical protein